MFYNCKSLEYLPDISILNTKNIIDMSDVFYNCKSLKELPDISKWNTENVKKVNSMFENCRTLTALPNISKWNANNFINLNYMFKNCKSLLSLPNISIWDIHGQYSHYEMYEGDELLFQNNTQRREDNMMLRFYVTFISSVKFIFSKFCNYFSELIFLLFTLFILFSIYSCFPFLFNWSYLDESIKSINNPKDYFNLTGYINVSHISKTWKITKEASNNNDLLIKEILNFAYINGNKTIESDLKLFDTNNIIYIINNCLNIIIIIFIYLNINYQFLNINSKKKNIILSLPFIFDLISIIYSFLNNNIDSKLLESIKKYYNIVKEAFRIKIPEENFNELEKLKLYSSIIFLISFCGSLVYFIYIFALLKKLNTEYEEI